MATAVDRIAFALFPTAIGECGLAWAGRGLVGVALPQGSEEAARRHILRRFAGATEEPAPPEVAATAGEIVALLNGEARDLRVARLDMGRVGAFERAVYEIARGVPPGETITYGEVARRLGDPGAARQVGQALGANPFPIVVPCHRVLGADGKVGGFSARGGVATKARLLQIEKARTSAAPLLFEDLAVSVRPEAPTRP